MTPRSLPLCVLCVLVLILGEIPAGPAGPADGEWMGGGGRADGYRSYDEITSALASLETQHPDIVKRYPLATTYEGRTVWAVRLSYAPAADEGEPGVLVMGAHHARELISAEVPLRILAYMAGAYGSDANITREVNTMEFWFLPLVNPDGYEYARTVDPMWRKNRRPVDQNGDGTSDGTGVDLNRNYGHLWGQQGTTKDVTKDTEGLYCGPAPFSENETASVRDLVQAPGRNFSLSISYHSYGQYILYPWGNSIDPPATSDPALAALARNMSLAMPASMRYTPMMAYEMYPATGDTDDWLFANESVLPFTIELATGFAPPVSEIPGIYSASLPAALTAFAWAEARGRVPVTDAGINRLSVMDEPFVPGGPAAASVDAMNYGNTPVEANLTLAVSGPGGPVNLSRPVALQPGGKRSEEFRWTLPAGGEGTYTVAARVSVPGDARAGNDAASTTFRAFHRTSLLISGPAEIVVETGRGASAEFRVANNGTRSENISIAATSGYPENLSLAPESLNLLPGGYSTVRLAVAPPTASVQPGRYTVEVSATPGSNPQLRSIHSLSITVSQPGARRLALALSGPPAVPVYPGGSREVAATVSDGVAGDAVSVTLDAYAAPPAWRFQVSAIQFILDANGSAAFSLSAFAPPGAAAWEEGAVTVRANGAASGIAIAAATFVTEPVRMVRFSAGTASLTIPPGGRGRIPLWIENGGNTEERVRIEVAETPPGWNASAMPGWFTLVPGDNMSVDVEVAPRDGAAGGSGGTVVARLLPDGLTASVRVAVAVVHGVEARMEGGSILIRNTGNAPDTVHLSTNRPDTVALSEGVVALAPGEWRSVALQYIGEKPHRLALRVKYAGGTESATFEFALPQAGGGGGPWREAIIVLAQTLWLLAPLYSANQAAVLFGGGRPLDGGRVHRDGRRLFGGGKTWNGLLGGIMVGLFAGTLQVLAVTAYPVLPLTNFDPGFYGGYLAVLLSLSAGALLGDLVKSYFKRRAGLEPGAPSPYLLDQLDFVIGAFVLTAALFPGWFFGAITVWHVVLAVAITPILHRAANIAGYKLGKKAVPW